MYKHRNECEGLHNKISLEFSERQQEKQLDRQHIKCQINYNIQRLHERVNANIESKKEN